MLAIGVKVGGEAFGFEGMYLVRLGGEVKDAP
jgi:hypothetical protein